MYSSALRFISLDFASLITLSEPLSILYMSLHIFPGSNSMHILRVQYCSCITDVQTTLLLCRLIYHLMEMEDVEVAAAALQLPDELPPIRVSQCMAAWRAIYDYSQDIE